MTIDWLERAGIVQGLCEGIAKYCPKAWVAIISNPVNSTVPIAAEVFKKCALAYKSRSRRHCAHIILTTSTAACVMMWCS